MKVYISSHDSDLAEDAAMTLRMAGHTIVSTWHIGSVPRPPSDDPTWAAKAEDNFRLIDTADALVLLSGPGLFPGGKFVEAGHAIGRRRVIVVGRRENGMLWHPAVEWVESVEDIV
jgi:hypothetical protein